MNGDLNHDVQSNFALVCSVNRLLSLFPSLLQRLSGARVPPLLPPSSTSLNYVNYSRFRETDSCESQVKAKEKQPLLHKQARLRLPQSCGRQEMDRRRATLAHTITKQIRREMKDDRI